MEDHDEGYEPHPRDFQAEYEEALTVYQQEQTAETLRDAQEAQFALFEHRRKQVRKERNEVD